MRIHHTSVQLTENTSLHNLCYGSLPHPTAARPRVKWAVSYRKRQWPKTKNDRGSFHVHESWHNVNILSQIIGPAAAGSAGPVPTPCGRHGAATVTSACSDNDDVVTVARRLARRRRRCTVRTTTTTHCRHVWLCRAVGTTRRRRRHGDVVKSPRAGFSWPGAQINCGSLDGRL